MSTRFCNGLSVLRVFLGNNIGHAVVLIPHTIAEIALADGGNSLSGPDREAA
jgi:hypothetical protein